MSHLQFSSLFRHLTSCSDLQTCSALYHTGCNIRGPQRYPTPPATFSAPGCAYYHWWWLISLINFLSRSNLFDALVMTLTFFFKVQDTGSWLEIGQSISFFCITSMLLLWSAGICATGEYLMKDVLSRKVGDVVVAQVSAEKKNGWVLKRLISP